MYYSLGFDRNLKGVIRNIYPIYLKNGNVYSTDNVKGIYLKQDNIYRKRSLLKYISAPTRPLDNLQNASYTDIYNKGDPTITVFFTQNNDSIIDMSTWIRSFVVCYLNVSGKFVRLLSVNVKVWEQHTPKYGIEITRYNSTTGTGTSIGRLGNNVITDEDAILSYIRLNIETKSNNNIYLHALGLNKDGGSGNGYGGVFDIKNAANTSIYLFCSNTSVAIPIQ